MNKPLIAGNWKMYKTLKDALDTVEELAHLLAEVKNVHTVICPSFTALWPVAVKLKQLKADFLTLGAQNMSWTDWGAYTGEVAPMMLKELGCRYVILGHSERRQYFGETDALVQQKTKTALAYELTPIVCVGERIEEKESGLTETVVRRQLEGALSGLTPQQVASLVIAYEPVWAIGTGHTASATDAQQVIGYIRSLLTDLFGAMASETRIQYGGSVKPENIVSLMAQPDIDGALVGGASLEASGLAAIVKAIV